MARSFRLWTDTLLFKLLPFSEIRDYPVYYKVLRRNMILLMIVVTIIPLSLMYIINHHLYQKTLMEQSVQPLRALLNKTRHSFDLFLAERRSAVSFIASAYDYEELVNQQNLNRIFQVMKREFGGSVDLGLIDSSGMQVSYSGPYQLTGKDYKEQEWFQEVILKGTHISDVFMGYRKFPHFVIAVQHYAPAGGAWIVRSTIDTEKFNSLITSMGLEPDSDAFVLNREGVFQTPSRLYGAVLEKCPLSFSHFPTSETTIIETEDPQGNAIFLGSTNLESAPFTLVMVKPRLKVLISWYTLKNKLFIIFVLSVTVIFLVVFKLTGVLVKRIEELEQKQRQAFHEMEHTSKLALIGKLAAGVAHEVNNPMAIIDQKAGLMKDLIEPLQEFPHREKFLNLTGSIMNSVDRCRTITHRLLGFARRMDVEFRDIDVNEVIEEVLSFLEKEAQHRNIQIVLELSETLPHISSDQGQLQQVFLNILNNAFAAIDDGGKVTIGTREPDPAHVAVLISDNGIGMSEETMEHIFEPFFTTKKEYGTGLGLSITYGIITKLNGDIQVQSKEGEGTTFIITLPKQHTQGRAIIK